MVSKGIAAKRGSEYDSLTVSTDAARRVIFVFLVADLGKTRTVEYYLLEFKNQIFMGIRYFPCVLGESSVIVKFGFLWHRLCFSKKDPN